MFDRSGSVLFVFIGVIKGEHAGQTASAPHWPEQPSGHLCMMFVFYALGFTWTSKSCVHPLLWAAA